MKKKLIFLLFFKAFAGNELTEFAKIIRRNSQCELFLQRKTIFSCPNASCLFLFKNFESFFEHLDKHNHIKKGICTICNQEIPFSYNSDHQHILTHVNRFECKACGFKSPCQLEVIKHIKKKHIKTKI